MRLLVVEDEIKTGDYPRQGLTEAGFLVSLARNGLDGHLDLAMTESFDLIILDVMLPDVGGWRIVQSLREAGRQTPVFTLQSLPLVEEPKAGSSRVAKVAGFSVHAGIVAEAHQRDKLERLCRYIARPAVSEKRLSLVEDGRIRYELKTPYRTSPGYTGCSRR